MNEVEGHLRVKTIYGAISDRCQWICSCMGWGQKFVTFRTLTSWGCSAEYYYHHWCISADQEMSRSIISGFCNFSYILNLRNLLKLLFMSHFNKKHIFHGGLHINLDDSSNNSSLSECFTPQVYIVQSYVWVTSKMTELTRYSFTLECSSYTIKDNHRNPKTLSVNILPSCLFV